MQREKLRELLESFKRDEVEIGALLESLARLPFADLDFARVDHHRSLRQGIPEVILALEKTAEQVIGVAQEIVNSGSNLLITRLDQNKANVVLKALPTLKYNQQAGTASLSSVNVARQLVAPVVVVTAGTSDLPVAMEACETLELCGVPVRLLQDVGVAGLQRVLDQLPSLREAPAIIAIAGMEGALASVIGGLVACPVVAVPTSVGYGAAFKGVAALLGMLTSCAAGVTVVNIDNGFGAAIAVVRMLSLQNE